MARNATRATNSGEVGKPYEYEPNFRGPLHNRSCTDVICLLIFAVFILCWIFIATFAYVKGNPETLTLPKDSNGSRCGYDSHVKDKKYLLFFDLTKCVSSTLAFTGCNTPEVCVSQCPERTIFGDKNTLQKGEFDYYKRFCLGDVKDTDPNKLQSLIDDGVCPKWILQSTNVLWRCMPDPAAIDELENQLSNEINLDSALSNIEVLASAQKVGKDIVDDIQSAWKEILGCVLMGIAISVIYIAIMRWIAGIMVWVSLIGSAVFLGFCVYYTSDRYVYYKEHDGEYESSKNYLDKTTKTKGFWLALLIIASILLIVLLLVLLVLRKRIRLAIALVEEGSKAVSAATSTLFFPIVPWLIQIATLAFFVSVALYLSTSGTPVYKIKDLNGCKCTDAAANYQDGSECDPQIFDTYCKCSTAQCSFVNMNNPAYVPYFHVVNVFGMFWLVFFASAFGEMVLAGTFATWYWTKPKSKVPFFTLTAAVARTIRYHVGTLAFGSLLVAICRMIRVLLEYIDNKLKKYDNAVTRAIMCCLKCFFYCLEKFIKFINRNAYIMCAIHGKNFCTSAKDAFNLLLRNILRTFVLDKVVDFLFFLSKLLIALGVGCITYTILEYVSETKLTYTYVPAIFVAICTYFLTVVFFSVYTMAVDTLFLCYLEDSERNDGSAEKPYFMSSNLRKIFGHKNKRS